MNGRRVWRKTRKRGYIAFTVEKRALEPCFTSLMIFVLGAGGCAHTQTPAASRPPALAASLPSVSSATVQLDSLPYTYTHHGVEIRVYSIELNPPDRLGVNVKLQETRGETHEGSALHLAPSPDIFRRSAFL